METWTKEQEIALAKEHAKTLKQLSERVWGSPAGKSAIERLKARTEALEKLTSSRVRNEISPQEFDSKFRQILKRFPIENQWDYSIFQQATMAKQTKRDSAARSHRGKANKEKALTENEKQKAIFAATEQCQRLLTENPKLRRKEFVRQVIRSEEINGKDVEVPFSARTAEDIFAKTRKKLKRR